MRLSIQRRAWLGVSVQRWEKPVKTAYVAHGCLIYATTDNSDTMVHLPLDTLWDFRITEQATDPA